jgi:uncharacterized 2Fe-2S/4Fe-4S cluster protein (DUF4445 family)
MDVLLAQGVGIAAPCGGNGRCGKCQVRLTVDGQTKVVSACQTLVTSDCVVEIPDASLVQTVIPDLSVVQMTKDAPKSSTDTGSDLYMAAIDLGTTTIAAALIRQDSGETVSMKKEWNRQISYGADVISRTKYIMEHENGLSALSSLIKEQIAGMISSLCEASLIPKERVRQVCISGNTIMQHIFAGLNPSPITAAPYVPETLFEQMQSRHFTEFQDKEVFLMPCIAGYVGGDITSGLYASGLYQKEGTYLFLDIGTNGEMAIGGKDGFVCCSVASGPAFEGAEITCGMTSVDGAVCHLEWKENVCKFETEVIGQTAPTGFCGSGLIDLLAILLGTGILDETGRLLSPKEAKQEVPRLTMARLKNALGYNFLAEDENGNGIFYLRRQPAVFLTISDVRKLQLAKAAIAAGIEVLLKETGLSYDDIDGLFLAGGLGESLNKDNAAAIGMIPEALKDKIVCVGNSSLAGARQVLLKPEDRQTCTAIAKTCRYIELSGNPAFNTEFIQQMTFER